jgi:cellulose biosynthesis protein BcsQ
MHATAALVGAAGGVGTTRLAVETAATLARDGRDAAVLDVALATEGLAGYVPGRIDPDATGVYADDAALDDALVDIDAGTPGRLAVCPAHAPFERLARAKSVEAAGAFEDALAAAARSFDHVVVDTPPVADNLSVAAVTAAERTGVVTPATTHGTDALQRTRGRLADVGSGADVAVANRATSAADADVVVPTDETTDATAPACADGGAEMAPAVGALAAELFGVDLDIEFPAGLLEEARRRL